MGAWGYGPMDNDWAWDWIAYQVATPLVQAIKNSLEAYLEESEVNDVRKHECEAAAGLLVDLTHYCQAMKYSSIEIRYQAEQENLWDLAIRAIKKMMKEKVWISVWDEPKQKVEALRELISELRIANKAWKSQKATRRRKKSGQK
jgi:hypothetical protein